MTYCCTQCMKTFEDFEMEQTDEGDFTCPYCKSSKYVEPFNNEDEE